MPDRRILVVCMDACDKELLNKWSSEGLLPTIRRLQETSAHGITAAPEGLFVGAVWPSFWTSLGPDRHGRYCYEQIKTGTYENMPIKPINTDGTPWWEHLSKSGKRVAILDVPKTYPSTDINGVQICDWGTHDPDHDRVTTSPPELADRIVEKYGEDQIRNCNAYAESPETLKQLAEHLIWRIERKTDMILDLLGEEPWDCFVAAYGDSHCAGHQAWHLYDTSDIHYTPEASEIAGNPLLTVYIALDNALARLIDAVGDEYDVMVLASHGFRSHYDATFMLDEILARMERPTAVRHDSRTSMAKKAWMTLPAGARQMLKPVKRKARSTLGVPQRKTRRYFQVPNNDAVGGIRFNLRGREPEGIVATEEVDALCDEIREQLTAFVNVETGARLVRDVVRVDSVYQGPKRDMLPDLFVYWNHETPVNLISSPRTGEIADQYTRGRTGDHTPLGMFFYRAPDVATGAFKRGVKIEDIGPTIADRLGVPLPDVDGVSFADELSNGIGVP